MKAVLADACLEMALIAARQTKHGTNKRIVPGMGAAVYSYWTETVPEACVEKPEL